MEQPINHQICILVKISKVHGKNGSSGLQFLYLQKCAILTIFLCVYLTDYWYFYISITERKAILGSDKYYYQLQFTEGFPQKVTVGARGAERYDIRL